MLLKLDTAISRNWMALAAHPIKMISFTGQTGAMKSPWAPTYSSMRQALVNSG